MLIRILVGILVVSIFTGALAAGDESQIVWTSSSIGPAFAQSASSPCSALCPAFTITAAGGLSAQEDIQAFTHRALSGDGYLIARVTDIRGPSSALAGLSIRASLSQGAVQLSILRSASGSLLIRKRTQLSGYPTQTTATALSGAAWLRLERKGGAITLGQSTDGSQWTSIPGVLLDLPESVFIGLAVTSQRPDAIASATFSGVRVTPSSTLPDGWTKVDLDGTGASSQVRFADNAWVLSHLAAGTSTGEPVSFVYKRVSGDAELSARVASLVSPSGVAGLMVRSTLEPDSPYLFLRTSALAQRSVRRRQAAGMMPTTTSLSTGTMPGWLKVVRLGPLLSLYHSRDGSAWTLLVTDTVDLTASFYVGLAIARGASSSAVATIDNVRVRGVSANELPTISLTAPTPAKTVLEGDPLALAATASDPDDRVEAVEFFVDGRRVGVDTAAPYLASWSAAGVGSHQVTATARDSDGAVVRTSPVSVNVMARSAGGGEDPTDPPDGTGTWHLAFAPSLDHDRTVDRYTVQILSLDRSAMVAFRDLGRPAIVSGECRVDLTSSIIGLPAGRYQVIVRAVDDSTGAQSVGAMSEFDR